MLNNIRYILEEYSSQKLQDESPRELRINIGQWLQHGIDIPIKQGQLESKEGQTDVERILEEVLEGVTNGRLKAIKEEVGHEEPSREGEYVEEELGIKTEPVLMRMKKKLW